MKRLNEIEKQKTDIEKAITKEQIKAPTYSLDEYRMALCNYRKLDITKQDGKRKLIDTFINAQAHRRCRCTVQVVIMHGAAD